MSHTRQPAHKANTEIDTVTDFFTHERQPASNYARVGSRSSIHVSVAEEFGISTCRCLQLSTSCHQFRSRVGLLHLKHQPWMIQQLLPYFNQLDELNSKPTDGKAICS
uniref:Uncharacterized protein n=1 Tax=Physcomitrium patens TaxID=3218 RepID=A0A2K1KLY5_PHYPA|nr:hypothetical protein PHYPA_005693 [Physcomitrium patens]